MPFLQDELSQLFVEHVCHEVENARRRWPGNTGRLATLTKQVSELMQALSQHKAEKGEAMRVWCAAVQVAAMALRLATESRSEMLYQPGDALAQLGVEVLSS